MPADALPIALLATAVIGGLALLGWLGRQIFNNPRGDFESGAALLLSRIYVRVVHLLRVRGRSRIPQSARPGPMIVVANHTAGVDPVLVQAACPFHIRWMMARDMQIGAMAWFWTWWEIIAVDREKRGSASLREALRHLKAGGVIGIFPEGGLERPPGQVMPFQEGIGLLIAKTGAKVLPVTIAGTPQFDPAWASLWRFSASTIHFHDIIDYAALNTPPEAIAADLRRRFLIWTGWPANDNPPPWQMEANAPPYGALAEGAPPVNAYGQPIRPATGH